MSSSRGIGVIVAEAGAAAAPDAAVNVLKLAVSIRDGRGELNVTT